MDYISKDDKTRLEAQLEELRGNRKVLTERIAAARALGDLRENAEYHASREDQGLNEMKIKQLEERLSRAIVTEDDASRPADVVFMGATVKLRDIETEVEELYRLVGDVTGDLNSDVVEVTPSSPLGLALMKARLGEVIRVDLRRREKRFEIIEIVM